MGKTTVKDRPLIKKVDYLGVKVSHLDVKVGHLDKRVGNLEVKVDNIDTKLDRLEVNFVHLTAKVDNLADNLSNLAGTVDRLTMTLDDLAAMVARGFEHMATKDDIAFLSKRIDLLEDGHEQILLRLENTVYRFEHQDLEKRVIKLENKQAKI